MLMYILSLIKENFHYAIVVIIIVSVIPIGIEYLKEKRQQKQGD